MSVCMVIVTATKTGVVLAASPKEKELVEKGEFIRGADKQAKQNIHLTIISSIAILTQMG